MRARASRRPHRNDLQDFASKPTVSTSRPAPAAAVNETYTAVKKAAVDEDDDEQEEGEAKPKLRRQHGAHAGHAAAVIQIETRGVGPIQYRLDADHRRR